MTAVSRVRPLQKIHQNFFISANAFVQAAGIAALYEAQPDVVRMRAVYDERRRAIIAGLRRLGFGIATELKTMLILAGAVGFFMIGMISGMYAILGAMYPVRVRNTGTGLALGIGRLGAVVGPALAGVLIAAGWSRPLYCFVLALPLLVSAVLIRRVPLLFGQAADGMQPALEPAE